MLFGRDKEKGGKTVLILDIESGSVAAALARRNPDGTLSILSESRSTMPVRPHRSAEALAAEIERLAAEAIAKMSAYAARLRTQSPQPQAGIVSDVAVFMAPPWGKPNLQNGRPDFVPHLQDTLRRELSPYFEAPPSFYTNAGAAAAGMRTLAPQDDKYLLCIVTHEMSELLLIHNGAVAGHATIPHGINLPLRTLKSHGNLSDAEARSALKLGHLSEPLTSATETFAAEFLSAGKELFDAHTPQQVWVVSSAGDYFARALSHEGLAGIFPQGGEVRALRPSHALPHLPGHPGQDLFIILEALYIMYI